MDICNRLSPIKFAEADDFLTFISIYEDKARERAYKKLLWQNRHLIEGKVCVEAGCGMGIFSEYMASLKAKKVYAIEVNPHMYKAAKKRLSGNPVIEVVNSDITKFDPGEKINVCVHELYGQLLLDEELLMLEKLKFKPVHMLPDGGKLQGGITMLNRLHDRIVTPEILAQLDSVLVSGLFDEGKLPLKFDILEWQWGKKTTAKAVCDIRSLSGDLLYMGVRVMHKGREICRAGKCPNWSFIWTPRTGNCFSISFSRGLRAPDPMFGWQQ